jgi:integrase
MADSRETTARERLSLSSETKQRVRARGNGEGMIRHLAQRDLWEVRLMVGVKPNGKPDIRSRYAKTRAEAVAKLDELRQRVRHGSLGDAKAERQTVAAFLTRWLETIQATVRVSTALRYDQIVRLHLIPELGRHRLAALKSADIQAFYAHKLAARLRPATVRKMHNVLHRALTQAVRWGEVPRNVVDAVDPPAVPREELHPPTPEEIARLLDAAHAAKDDLASLWTAAFYTGCRAGELLGLKWSDLDLDTGTLKVQRTLLGAKDCVPRFGEPKTAQSRRTISLPDEAVRVLREHRQRQVAGRLRMGDDSVEYGLVFATRVGTPLLHRNVIRAFKLALRRAGLPESVRVHDLRHALATAMRGQNVDLKTVSEHLGHSSIRITADLYQHGVPRLDTDAVASVQRAVRGSR